MTFPEKLTILIKERGMDRKEFALASGIPYTTIDKWYSRSYENMAVSSMRTVCEFFNVTMDSMAYDENDIVYRHPTWRDSPLGLEDEALLDAFWNGDDRTQKIMFNLVHGQYNETQKEAISLMGDPFELMLRLGAYEKKGTGLSEEVVTA